MKIILITFSIVSYYVIYSQDYIITTKYDISNIEVNWYNNDISVYLNSTQPSIFVNPRRDFYICLTMENDKIYFVDKFSYNHEKSRSYQILLKIDDNLSKLYSIEDKDETDNLKLVEYKFKSNLKTNIVGDFKVLKLIDMSNPSINDRQEYKWLENENYKNLAKNNVQDTLLEQRYIVLHQTHSKKIEQAVSGFNEKGTSTHYIVNDDGKIFFIVPIYRISKHVGGEYTYDIKNFNSIGIEHVNPVESISRCSLNDFENHVKDFNTSPSFTKALIRLKTKSFKWFNDHKEGAKWQFYPNINGKQKRSTWLLINKLIKELSIDSLVAHELCHNKKPGEGIVIYEFFITMNSLIENVDLLHRAIIDKSTTLKDDEKELIEDEIKVLNLIKKETRAVLEDNLAFKLLDDEDKLLNSFYENFDKRVEAIGNLMAKYKLPHKDIVKYLYLVLLNFFNDRGY